MVLAVETQSSLSVHVMNSDGLKSGFFAVLMALDLSSSFLEMVDLMVLAAGTSISLAAGLLPFIALGLVDVVEEAEELEEDDDVVDDEDDEQVLLSESESLCEFVVCPGMLPVVLSVSMCGLSEVKFVECVGFVCVSVCLWISASLSVPSLAARGRTAGLDRGRWCSVGVCLLYTSDAADE